MVGGLLSEELLGLIEEFLLPEEALINLIGLIDLSDSNEDDSKIGKTEEYISLDILCLSYLFYIIFESCNKT